VSTAPGQDDVEAAPVSDRATDPPTRKPAAPAGLSKSLSPDAGAPSRLENLAEQILQELRRRNEQVHADFSVSKLLAGIVQVIALAAVFFAYLRRDTPEALTPALLVALFLQTLTISLLIMGRQR
jgi:hypothetical protein